MCTGLYVGKDCSADCTRIIARSADSSINFAKATCINCNDAKENINDNIIYSEQNGFSYEMPNFSYKYLSSPHLWAKGAGSFVGFACNEYGMSVTATITGYTSPKILEVDPFIKTGLNEPKIAQIAGSISKTAKEGVLTIAKVIEKTGNAEANIVLLTDLNEAWMMELYSGHEWAAIKLPDDKVSVFGNEFMIQTEYVMDDKSCFLHSDNLFEMPKSVGLDVSANGKMSLCETYAGKDRLGIQAHVRTYFGHKLLAPSKTGNYEALTRYDLLFEPDKKVSLKDIFELYRCRFEGSEFCPDETGADDIYPIGTEFQYTAHVIQTHCDANPKMANVVWICLANTEHSVFLPYSNLMSQTHENYDYKKLSVKYSKENQTWKDSLGGEVLYYEDIAFVCFKRLCALAEQNRVAYGRGVREFWSKKEDKLIEEFENIYKQLKDIFEKSETDAEEFINKYIIETQDEAYKQAKQIFDELVWFIIKNTRTTKRPWDYKTLSFGDLLKPEFTPTI